MRDPWVSMITAGYKTWELRGSRARIRGRIGLIRSGTGMVVGEADLTNVFGPLDREQLAQSTDLHRVDVDWSQATLPYKAVFAWVLGNAIAYERPVPYCHRPGAVIWVSLEGLAKPDRAHAR